MKAILRTTLILSSSSLVSLVVGLVSAKAWALLLGPSGLGFMGLLQALLNLAGLIAGLGVGAGLIRLGAQALAQAEDCTFAALQRAAWLLYWVMGGLALLVLVILRVPLSSWMLGGPEHAASVVLMGFALFFNLASGLQTSLLNAHHRVNTLAQIGVVNSVFSTATSLAIVWFWREHGIVAAVIAGSIAGWLVSSWYLKRDLPPVTAQPTRQQLGQALRVLLRFGLPYAVSMLVGTGVQFALPALVLHMLGTANVGFYRAALSVAGVYLGFLLLAMGQDYYPRIAAVSDQPAELNNVVNQQQRLVLLLGTPLILVTMLLTPYLVPLIYSEQFRPAINVLEWYLIGDLFKFSSWTMGFVILVRSSRLTYFLVELAAGINILLASWLGMAWFGLEGVGIGFMVMYILHYALVWVVVRHEISFGWTRENWLMQLAAVVAVFGLRLLPMLGLDYLRMPVGIVLVLVASLGSLAIIWRELGGIQHVRSWLRSNPT